MRALCVIPVLLSVVMSQDSASVEYLRGVPRHGDESFTDYFFSCNTTGSSLDWEINGDFTLSFFGNLSAGVLRQRTFTNIVSFATLLSISHIANDRFRYGSVLVVSSTTRNLPLTLQVECFVGGTSASETTNNSAPGIQNPIVTAASDNIFFQYLFSTSILNETMTHVYFCGVNSTTQGWVVDNSMPLLINSNDPVGLTTQRLSADFANQKAILISMEIYNISSVFFVTGPQVLDVGCISIETNANINASQVIASIMYTDPGTTTMFPNRTDVSPTTDITPTDMTTTDMTASPPQPARGDPCAYCYIIIPACIAETALIIFCIILSYVSIRWCLQGRKDAKMWTCSDKPRATLPLPMGDMSKEQQLQVEDISKEMPA